MCFEFEKGKRELEFGSNLSATHLSSGKKKILSYVPNPAGVVLLHSM